jgi:hypothetical protein
VKRAHGHISSYSPCRANSVGNVEGERKLKRCFQNFVTVLRYGEGMSRSQRLPLSSSQHHQPSCSCPSTNSAPAAISRECFHLKRVQLITQRSYFRYSLSIVTLGALEVWAGLIQKLHRLFSRTVLRLSNMGALYPTSFSQIFMGNNVAWLLKKERRYKCARVLSFSPNRHSATKNCS